MWNWAVLRTSISFEQLCLWRSYPNHATTVSHYSSSGTFILLPVLQFYSPTYFTYSPPYFLLPPATYPLQQLLAPVLLVSYQYHWSYSPDYNFYQLHHRHLVTPRHPIVKHRRPFLSYHRRQKKEEERKIQYLYILHLQSSTTISSSPTTTTTTTTILLCHLL